MFLLVPKALNTGNYDEDEDDEALLQPSDWKKPRTSTASPAALAKVLKGMRQSVTASAQEGRLSRETRVPMGWSFPKRKPKGGVKPQSVFCNADIEYKDEVRYRYFANEYKVQICIDHYHCDDVCIGEADKDRLDEFMNKKWSRKRPKRFKSF